MASNWPTAINGIIILIYIFNGYMKHFCCSSYSFHLMGVFMYTLIGVLRIMLKLCWMKFLVRIRVQTALVSKMKLYGIINPEVVHKNAMPVNTILFSST